MSISVVVADDHDRMRVALRRALENEGMDVVGEARDGSEAIEVVAGLQPAVLVLDLAMPGTDGWDVLEALPALGIATRVVAYSGAIDATLTKLLLKAGAFAAVDKNARLEDLLAAIVAASRDHGDAV